MPRSRHPRAGAATFAAMQREGLAENPTGVAFTIAFVAGQQQFFHGEPIQVELCFTSSCARTYRLDAARYDRRGRLDLDEYRVDPGEHVVDPLRDYFEHEAVICGGISSMPVLGEQPQRMVFELNEWCRFDAPGHYRLFVRSRRIQREDGDGVTTATTTSNILEFTIVAIDPTTGSRTVDAALATLRDARDDRAHRAARTLRFLGTEEAAAAMVDHFAEDDIKHEIMFGLIASPHRAAIVQRMEARLIVEDAAISALYIDTLALLRSWLDAAPGRTGRAAARPRRAAAIDEYAARLAGALASKRPAARAVAIETLLQIAWQLPAERAPSWFAAATTALPLVFAGLPAATQSNLLVYRWRQLAGPALRPVLARLLNDPRSSPDLRTTALKRLFELDPAAARPHILAAIGSTDPLRFGVLAMEALGALPDETLPELDDALARRLEAASFGPNELTLAARLVARYATPAIAARVEAVWTRVRDHHAVAPCAALLAYLLRVDPALGEREARRQLASAHRRSRELLSAAAGLHCGPALEGVLLEMLDDAAPEAVSAAATALGQHGSAAVEPRLWARLTRWHTRWQGRADELRGGLIEASPDHSERHIEGALAHAIANGRAWLTDGDALERLARLLVTPHPTRTVERLRREWRAKELKIGLHRSDTGALRISLAQYTLDSLEQLDAKLAQFPRGSAFVCKADTDPPQDYLDVERSLTARGMTLRR